ncbi:MAG TPA: clostripain-related cysteine peptidase [Candidatus Eremiobacteraeota bacterium]|nr:MAG: Clostripain precursor [bacterium ADurb.Bin363]HPZ09746.1 clostripain-related cysteine peptidase [Candidatus Eremiobacteraeota bacterium]
MIGKLFGFGHKIDIEEAKKTRQQLSESPSAFHQKETFTPGENIIDREEDRIKILRKLAGNRSQLIEISEGKYIDIINFDEKGEVTETETKKKEAKIQDSEKQKTFEVKRTSSGEWEIIEHDDLSKAEIRTAISEGQLHKGEIEVAGKKKLTVLYWGNGDGNLEPLVIRKLLDLEKIGSTEDINIVAQISRSSQEEIKDYFGEEYVESNIDGNWSKQARRYYVTKGEVEENPLPKLVKETVDSPVIENLGNIDMTDKTELLDFLITEMKAFPAEHYMVVYFDHGQGWKGVALDKEDTPSISPEDMGEITKKVKEATGQNIDIMVMENCLEGQAEALYPMKDSTDYIIASPEILWGSAFADNPGPIHLREGLEIIQRNEQNELNNPRLAATSLLKATANKNHAITLSVVDSKKLDALAEATEKLKEAIEKAGVTGEEICRAAEKTQQYEILNSPDNKHGFVDIGDLSDNIEASIEHSEVKKAARELRETLDKTVVARLNMQSDRIECQSDDGNGFISIEGNVKRCHGLSINLGKQESDIERKTYESLSFNRKTGWDEIIQKANWTNSISEK